MTLINKTVLNVMCVAPLMLSLWASSEDAKIVWKGRWQQGSLLLGHVPTGFRLKHREIDLPIADSGHFLLGLSRDADPIAEITVIDLKGRAQTQSYSVTQRKYAIQRIEGVPQDRVTPPESVFKRISQEASEVREARALRSLSEVFLEGFSAPLEAPLSGVYGSQRVYNGIPKRPHYGVDYAAATGTPVKAPAAGVVTLAHPDMYYSGGTLIVDHGHGLSSTFLHLSHVRVVIGQKIQRGDLIADVGASGRATGPHLDWRMNWHDVRIDPLLVLEALPTTN